eukprot:GILK01001463.1.p1 GENE.GILK01001463.1~~GILK01001463.1.p1  ORF type:complete len:293 (+),score=35.00 GILK01001463.1:86-964(+)
MPKITVAGKIDDSRFQKARVTAEYLHAMPDFTVEVLNFVELDWVLYLKELQRARNIHLKFSSDQPNSCGCVVLLNDKQYIGSESEFLDWAKQHYDYEDKTLPVFYQRLAQQKLNEYMRSTGRKYCFFEIDVDGHRLAPIRFELFTDLCPRTCENFRALCTGEKGESEGNKLHYKDSIVHRIVREGWIQAGDIAGGNGDGGESIYGPTFPDESFVVKHNAVGILGMANSGPHSNHSQFYITLAPLQFMDNTYVAFGRVISGLRTLKYISKEATLNERPLKTVKIVDCGEITDF